MLNKHIAPASAAFLLQNESPTPLFKRSLFKLDTPIVTKDDDEEAAWF